MEARRAANSARPGEGVGAARPEKQLFYCAERVMRKKHLPSGSTKWLFMSESLPCAVARKDHPRFVVLSSTRPLHPGIANQSAAQKVRAMRSTTADWLPLHLPVLRHLRQRLLQDGPRPTAPLPRQPSSSAAPTDGPSAATVTKPDSLTSLGSTWSGL